jgi:hypothetical protein
MSHCECAEEGTRNVVAECLGKLTLINSVDLLPKLKSYLSSPAALTRSTVITAVKFTISDQVSVSSMNGDQAIHFFFPHSLKLSILF